LSHRKPNGAAAVGCPQEEMARIKEVNAAKAKALSKEAVKGGIPLPASPLPRPLHPLVDPPPTQLGPGPRGQATG